MKTNSKYYPLFHYLSHSEQDRQVLRLAEIERILGKPLPPSARSQHGWWGNRQNALQAQAWMSAGYIVDDIDLADEIITFVRPIHEYEIQRQGDLIMWDRTLVKALRAHMGVSQAEFAEHLGVRQQTISEWETGVYAPSRATCKYLTLVAEQAGFLYGEDT